MLTEAERTRLRADVEASSLPDSCVVTRSTKGTFNATTGKHADPTTAEVFAGQCRVVAWPGHRRMVVTGEEAQYHRTYWVTLPHDALGIQIDDVVEITASADENLFGQSLKVKDVASDSFGIQRRLSCEAENPRS